MQPAINKVIIQIQVKKQGFSLDIDVEIPGQGVTAIFGPSGCGKTTLLRAIAGLEEDCQGLIQIGTSIWQNKKDNLPTYQRALGYVFQEASLFPHLNVAQNLHYGIKRNNTAKHNGLSLDNAVELLGIQLLLKRLPYQLSGGEKQRVAIARAIALNPKVLLMDEPLASLDEARKKEILPYLENLHQQLNIPLIYISHSPQEVARLADHLLLLQQGKLIASGDIETMLTRLDTPLAHGEDAGALLETVVKRYDETYDLSYLAFSGGQIAISGKSYPLDQAIRLRIAARDVSLTLTHQTGTSILNIFPVTIVALEKESNSQLMVKLLAGNTQLLSRVTRKSAQLLTLHQGKQLFAQVKSVAILS